MVHLELPAFSHTARLPTRPLVAEMAILELSLFFFIEDVSILCVSFRSQFKLSNQLPEGVLRFE
jgi:hypothetical protein